MKSQGGGKAATDSSNKSVSAYIKHATMRKLQINIEVIGHSSLAAAVDCDFMSTII
jgi:hypothetical protein